MELVVSLIFQSDWIFWDGFVLAHWSEVNWPRWTSAIQLQRVDQSIKDNMVGCFFFPSCSNVLMPLINSSRRRRKGEGGVHWATPVTPAREAADELWRMYFGWLRRSPIWQWRSFIIRLLAFICQPAQIRDTALSRCSAFFLLLIKLHRVLTWYWPASVIVSPFFSCFCVQIVAVFFLGYVSTFEPVDRVFSLASFTSNFNASFSFGVEQMGRLCLWATSFLSFSIVFFFFFFFFQQLFKCWM